MTEQGRPQPDDASDKLTRRQTCLHPTRISRRKPRRHKGPLASMPLAIALAVVAFLAYLHRSPTGTFDASGPQAGTACAVPARATDGGCFTWRLRIANHIFPARSARPAVFRSSGERNGPGSGTTCAIARSGANARERPRRRLDAMGSCLGPELSIGSARFRAPSHTEPSHDQLCRKERT